jgi:GPH family glycoside/pentoside/hexuronide:cation symporter
MAVAYAIPAVGVTWTQILFTNYIFKYSVDTLGIAAATIGWILLVTRLWDAVSDPMIGFLTDGTRSRAGRRRPWILASTVPVALTTFFMWNPPRSLEGDALFWWMFFSIALWETAMTTLYVPYMALGSEITMEHHDRTRIAGYRHVLGGLGQASVIASGFLLANAESPDLQRDVALWLVAAGAAISAVLIGGGILRVRERPEHVERGVRAPARALRDILRNRHLLRLVVIYFFEISSVAAIGLLLPFICEYVVGRAGLWALLLGFFYATSYVSTPLLVRLSRRLGKKRTWMLAMATQALGFASTLAAGTGDEAYLILCMMIVGLGAAGGHVLGMSVLADTVDYDDLQSGERKEALHYAAINIARKVSFASLTAVVGVAMEWIGYVPNADQTPEALFGLSALFAGIPSSLLLLAIALLIGFRLTEDEHARIRAELDARYQGS